MISRVLLQVVGLSVAACTGTPEPLPPAVRFVAAIPEGQTLDTFAVSPDGRSLAYAAESAADRRRRIHVRAFDASTERDRELSSTSGGTSPFFSPDGAWIAYFSRGGVWRVPAEEERRIAEDALALLGVGGSGKS